MCIYRYVRWFKAMNLHGATQCHVCSAFASMVRCIILYSGYHQMHSEWGSEWLQTMKRHFWQQQGDHTPWAHRWFIEALEDSSSGSPYVNHEWPSWRIFFRIKPSTNERISGAANWVFQPFGPEDQPDVCQHAREPDVCNTRGRGTCATESYFQLFQLMVLR